MPLWRKQKAQVPLSLSQRRILFGVVTLAIFKTPITIYGKSCGTHSCSPKRDLLCKVQANKTWTTLSALPKEVHCMYATNVRDLKKKPSAVLFRDGVLSLGAATKLSGLPLVDFIQHLSSLDIEIVKADETVAQEAKDVDAWLKL